MISNHDSLINIIENELRSRGFSNVFKNVNYNHKSCGEIDLYALKGDYVLLFEMKTNHNYKNRKKAISQLERAKKNCFSNKRVFCFYVSNYRNPRVFWVKNYDRTNYK